MRRPSVNVVEWTSMSETSGVLAGVSAWAVTLRYKDGTYGEYGCRKAVAFGAAHLLGKRVTVRLKRSRVASVEVCGG